jgi:hypothetical protein
MKITKLICIATISTGLLSGCGNSGNSAGQQNNNSTQGYTVTILNRSNNSAYKTMYNSKTMGPSYIGFQVSNTGTKPLTIQSLTLSANGPSSIVPNSDNMAYSDNNSKALNGCQAGTSLSSGQSCYVMIHADKNYQQLLQIAGSFDQTFTINTSQGQNTFDVSTQGVIYVGGEFKQLGDATATGLANSTLLARCVFSSDINTLSCTNPIENSNQKNPNGSIFALTNDNAGNIYIGGAFDEIGLLTTTNPYAAILAKFNPISNEITNPFADDENATTINSGADANIFGINFDSNNNLYITGIINNIGGAAGGLNDPNGGGYLLAKCDLSQSSNKCTNILAADAPSDDISANQAYSMTLYNNNDNDYLIIGGAMDYIGSTSGVVMGAGSCAITGTDKNIASNCASLVPTNRFADNFVYTTTVDNNANLLYIGGQFTTIDNVRSNSGNIFLAKCALNPTGSAMATCSDNALGGADDVYVTGGASSIGTFIGATALDNDGNIFVAGAFDKIVKGGTPSTILASTNNNKNMIARCAIDRSSCTDLLANAAMDGANDGIYDIVVNAEVNAKLHSGS